MPMSRNDAELAYDRAIPPGVIDSNLPDRFIRQPAARIVNVRPKPEVIIKRMADAMLTLALGAGITEAALVRMGFTTAEIKAYGQDAVRQMLVENDTLPSVVWGA